LWRGCNSRETVKDIIFLKKKFGLDGIFFLDDNFFTDKRRALEIISGMGLKFFAEIRADYVNEEFLKKLKEFGCVELYFGAESGSETMLKKMQKDISSGQIETAVRLCNDVGIKPILSFIMFYPNETNRERDETINFILRLLEKYSVQIEGPKLYTPYPGTKFFEECKSMGWVEPETTRDWAMLDRRISINGRSFIKKADYEKYSALLLSMLALIDLYNKEKMQRLLFYPMIALEKARLKKKIGFFPIETRAYFFLKSALARIA
jgi:radical SAM superfamily enzyme YgiQ (UPF0313 family)